jgi:hypothetical protein
MLANTGHTLTDVEANFLVSHYDIIGLGGTFGVKGKAEVMQAATAKQLKSAAAAQGNDQLKVIIYRNSEVMINESQADVEFNSHPEWRLKKTSGQPYGPQIWFDLTIPSCREWWVSTIVSAIAGSLGELALGAVISVSPCMY